MTPTRKQRFEAALKLAGMTMEEWRTDYHVVSAHHLNECFKGDEAGDEKVGRKMGPDLEAAIDRFIEETFAKCLVGAEKSADSEAA